MMRTALFAAALLPLLSAAAFAASEQYESGPTGVIESGPALLATGSEAYQYPSRFSTRVTSNVATLDVGSQATPVFAGKAATWPDAAAVAAYWRSHRG